MGGPATLPLIYACVFVCACFCVCVCAHMRTHHLSWFPPRSLDLAGVGGRAQGLMSPARPGHAVSLSPLWPRSPPRCSDTSRGCGGGCARGPKPPAPHRRAPLVRTARGAAPCPGSGRAPPCKGGAAPAEGAGPRAAPAGAWVAVTPRGRGAGRACRGRVGPGAEGKRVSGV